MRRTLPAAVACALAVFAAARTLAQPETPPPAPAEEAADLRERLEKAREELSRQQALVERLISRLDAGDPAEDVRRAAGFLAWMAQRRLEDAGGRFGEGRFGEGARGSGRDGDRPDFFGKGRDDDDRGHGEPDEADVTDEEVRAYVAERMPWMDERLERAAEFSDNAAERILRRMRPKVAELIRIDREDPVLGALKLEEMQQTIGLFEIGRGLRRSIGEDGSDEAIASARREIAAAVSDLFETIAAIRVREAERAAAHAEELLAETASMRERKSEIVEERVDEIMERLLRPSDDRGPWGPPRR